MLFVNLWIFISEFEASKLRKKYKYRTEKFNQTSKSVKLFKMGDSGPEVITPTHLKRTSQEGIQGDCEAVVTVQDSNNNVAAGDQVPVSSTTSLAAGSATSTNVTSATDDATEDTKPFKRVWVDGCFDGGHFGHANLCRLARQNGGELYVGIHTDQEIMTHKGAPPILTMEERHIMMAALKNVDKVIDGVPYVTTIETLDKYGCAFCSHGNDVTTTSDGVDTYHEVKSAGRYKEVERTQGPSSSGIIGGILKCTKMDLPPALGGPNVVSTSYSPENPENWKNTPYICTTRKFRWFADDSSSTSGGGLGIPEGAVVVYVAGAFDILNPGHVAFLEAAAKQGDYLIVGVHSDLVVSKLQGPHRPIMDVYQRAQSVLALKCVYDVVISAPYLITDEMLDHLQDPIVVHGRTPVPACPMTGEDPHLKAKKRGRYLEIDSGSKLTTDDIIYRVVSQRELYTKRNKNKEIKEAAEATARAADNLNLSALSATSHQLKTNLLLT